MTVRIVAVGALALLWAFVSWDWPKFLFLQSDTFWLIETGRYILEHHALPAHDIFSFTRQGSLWIVYQWLFEVVLAGLFAIGGWLSVSLLATLVLSWLFFVEIARWLLAAKANALIVLLVTVWAVFASLPDLVAVRPQLITFVFLWFTHKLLSRNWPSPDRTLWLLVPIVIVWANVHISFLIQLAVLTVYLLAASGDWLRRRLLEPAADRREDRAVVSRTCDSDFWIFLAILVACAAASLVNPYGIEIYQFISQSWQDHNITPELRPLDWRHNLSLLGYVLLACVSMVFSARNL